MAGKNIKGITIEIGGDTTKLGNAIADSEKKSRGLQTELRQVERLLKFDPSNVEALSQKQKILTDNVEATSEKLKILKESQEQVNEQFKLGEVSEEQMRELAREIEFTENSLNKMKDSLEDQIGSWKHLKTATEDVEEELNDVNDALELDPSNINLLIQKKKVLAENVKDTKNKLDDLKKAQEQVTSAFKRGEASEQQVREIEREVIKTEKALKDMKKELESQYPVWEGLKGKSEGALKAVGIGVTAVAGAAVAGGTYAVSIGTQFDKAFNTLQTKTGATKEEMEALNQSMENVYRNNFGESIEDVSNAMANVKQNTKLSGEELEKTTEYALLMRDTFEFEVNESTRTAKMLMDTFGLSAEESYNLIAQGAQNGLDKNGDLLDTINEYSVHFDQLGIDADGMFNMLVNGANNGTFSVDKLGDAVKEFGIRVKDGTGAEAFETLGLSVADVTAKFGEGGESARLAMEQVTTALFNVQDPIEQNRLGVELFGTQFEDLGIKGIEALFNLDGSIATTKGNLADINNQKYNDLGSELSELGRIFETDLIQPISEHLTPYVKEFAEYLKANGPQILEKIKPVIDAVMDIGKFLVENGSFIVSTIVGIGTGFAIWNVAQMIIGVMNAIKGVESVTKIATATQQFFNMVMNANPLLLIATIIGTVISALVTLGLTNESFGNACREVWEMIKNAFLSVWQWICDFFTVTIPNAISFVIEWFRNLPQNIWDGIVSAITKLGEWASQMWQVASTEIPKLIQNVWDWFKELPGKIWNGIVGAVTKLGEWGSKMWTTAHTEVSKIIQNVWDWFKELPGKIWNAIIGAVDKIGQWGTDMWNKATTKMGEVVQGIIDAFLDLPGELLNIGKNIIQGLIDGIASMGSALWQGVKNVVGNVTGWFKNLLGINSPSRVMRDQIGKPIGEGIAQGIDESTYLIEDSMSNISRNVIPTYVDEVVDELSTLGQDIIPTYVDETVADLIPTYVDEIVGEVTPTAQGTNLMTGQLKSVITPTAQGTNLMTGQPSATTTITPEKKERYTLETISKQLNETFKVESPKDSMSFHQVVEAIETYGEKLIEASKAPIVLDTGVLVGATANYMDYKLGESQRLKQRGL